MNEDVEMSACSGPWIVQETRSARCKARNSSGQVGNFDRDVMQTFAAFFNKLRDHRIRSSCFEQLDARIAGGQHGHVHFFEIDRFARADREAELLLVEPEGGIERAYGDTQVVNLHFV